MLDVAPSAARAGAGPRLATISATLLIPLAVLYARGEGEPPLLESILFIWMGGNLIAGALLLAARAVRPANRHALAPLALGVGLGIGPLALLDALPQALGHTPIMHAESASISGAAIVAAGVFAAPCSAVLAAAETGDVDLPGMMIFCPSFTDAPALRLLAAASSETVRWFFLAMVQRLSPLPTV